MLSLSENRLFDHVANLKIVFCSRLGNAQRKLGKLAEEKVRIKLFNSSDTSDLF